MGAPTGYLWTGNLSQFPGSPYEWQLTIPNTYQGGIPVGDVYATLRRGATFQARCPAGTSPFQLQGVWDYTNAGDANDVFVATDPCP